MSNINCSNPSCAFMNDGKCCLDTVTVYSKKYGTSVLCSSGDSEEKSCPYYVDKV